MHVPKIYISKKGTSKILNVPIAYVNRFMPCFAQKNTDSLCWISSVNGDICKLTAVDGDPFDSTRQLGLWSMVPAENAISYRKVTVEIINASIVERKYSFPNAFVIDYKED